MFPHPGGCCLASTLCDLRGADLDGVGLCDALGVGEGLGVGGEALGETRRAVDGWRTDAAAGD